MADLLTGARANVGLAVRDAVARWPALYVAVARMKRGRNRDVAGPGTDLVVEGYPRSGNTFLVSWIARYDPDVTVASHVHHVAHVRYAVRRGIPSVVVIREPRGAVASLAVMGGEPMPVLIRRYERFTRGILALADRVQVVDFAALTDDPAATVAAIADRWDLDLTPGETTEEAVAATFRDIDELQRRRFGAHDVTATSRPTEGREAQLAQAKGWLDTEVGRRTLAPARRLYEELVSS